MALYGSRREITQAWDLTQERLQCCGVDTWHDWNRYGPVPESCCQELFGGQRKECTIFPTITNLYNQGCLYVTTNFIRDHAAVIGGTSIAVAILMVSTRNGVASTMILTNLFRTTYATDIRHDILLFAIQYDRIAPHRRDWLRKRVRSEGNPFVILSIRVLSRSVAYYVYMCTYLSILYVYHNCIPSV